MAKKHDKLPIIVSCIGGTDIDIMNSWRMHNGLEKTHEQFNKNIDTLGEEKKGNNGPIRTLTDDVAADRVILIVSRASKYELSANAVSEWVSRGTSAKVEVVIAPKIDDPSDYDQVYKSLNTVFEDQLKDIDPARLYFNLSPGTPTMQALLLYMSQVRYPRSKAFRTTDPRFSTQNIGIPVEVNLPFKLSSNLYASQSSIVPNFEEIDKSLKIYGSCKSINILLLGESGVGKSEMAARIHSMANSDPNKFIVANCAELSLASDPGIFRSELFGSVKSAYTGATDKEGYFAKAAGGTLFFDEIAEIPLSSQALLLRALQEKKYSKVGDTKSYEIQNVRIIAATNHDLAEDVRQGKFREDLYYRIAMCPIYLNPLRVIAEHSGAKFKALVDENFDKIKNNLSKDDSKYASLNWSIDESAYSVLGKYSWPGNIRQLYQVLLLSSVYAAAQKDPIITGDIVQIHIPQEYIKTINSNTDFTAEDDTWFPDDIDEWLENKKKVFIERAMKKFGGKVSEVSKALGTTYQKIDYALKQNGIK